MTIATDLGNWSVYVPDPWPEQFPPNLGIMFCKRESDGVDWYTYSGNPFPEHTVLAVAVQENGYWTIRNATRDPSKLWPDGMLLLSFVDDTSDDPMPKYAGKVWSGGGIIDRPLAKADFKAYAANKRWQKEVGGITVNGIPIATDDRSKQMIMGARMAAEASSEFTTPWVASDGSVYVLTAANVIAISNAVLAHVGACFATYATVAAQIDSDEITATAQLDAAFG